MSARATCPAITSDMIRPALPLLDLDGLPTGGVPKEACCVVTSVKAPYVIQTANAAWYRTWNIEAADAVGKTLDVIAGQHSSNHAVRDKLLAASETNSLLSTWVDCGLATNYTTRGARVDHHLVIGPVRGSDGSVTALVAVSRVHDDGSAATGPVRRRHRISDAAELDALESSSDELSGGSPLQGRRQLRRSFRPALRRATWHCVGSPAAPQAPLTRSPRAAPERHSGKDDVHSEPRAPALPTRYAHCCDAADALHASTRGARRRHHTLGAEAFASQDEGALQAMLQRSDARIALRNASGILNATAVHG